MRIVSVEGKEVGRVKWRRGLKRNMRKIKSKKEHEEEARDTEEGDREEKLGEKSAALG